MRRFLLITALVVLLVGLVPAMPGLAQPATTAPQTYTVLVGYENVPKGVSVMSYFPGTVTIHAGDTVHWVSNSNEIHTVSFGFDPDETPLLVPAAVLGLPENPSPLVLNPLATTQAPESGAAFTGKANSGVMSLESDLFEKTYDLTFPTPGTYPYLCLVHGRAMSGKVEVVGSNDAIPSPGQSKAMANQEIAAVLAQVPAVLRDAKQQIKPPTMNANGTLTHRVMIGYSEMFEMLGKETMIDVMQFFPDRLVVRPGDTVVWEMSPANDAPHTVTFLNGAAGPEDFKPVTQTNGTVVLYLHPDVLFPSQPAPTLTREEFYNSGVMLPAKPPKPEPTYTLEIGNMSPGLQPYECLLHDASGMTGTLMVVPRTGRGPLQRFGSNE